MIIRNKFNGYSGDGRRLYPGGGGGAPSSQTVTQTTIPEYAKPYVERMLGKAEAFADSPYQAYGGQRIAEFSPLQQQAMQSAANLGPAKQLGTATQMAGIAGLRAGQAQYGPGSFSAQQVSAPSLNQYQMQQPGDVSTGRFTDPNNIQNYMSPYQQAVTDIEKREATRGSNILRQQQQAQAVQQGAFGGSRSAIVEAERQRNLGQQLGDIQARGGQAAFQQAAQQYQTDQQRALQAALANQQMGYGTGQANLQALLGVQGLGAQTGMQAQLANQQFGMEAQRLGEQSRQFGANYGMQGIQQQLAAAGMLGNLGQSQFAQEQGALQAQAAAGAQQQGLDQQKLTQSYQDFLSQRGHPQQQLAFMSDILRGGPLSQTTQQMYTAAPPMSSQVAQLGLGAYGLSQLGKSGFGFKEGGEVKGYAEGGIASAAPQGSVPNTMNIDKLRAVLEDLSDEQLEVVAANASDATQLAMVREQQALNARIRNASRLAEAIPEGTIKDEMAGGIAAAPVSEGMFADTAVGEREAEAEGMAQGGIVAFAKGKEVKAAETDPDIAALRSFDVSKGAFTPEQRQQAISSELELLKNYMGEDKTPELAEKLAKSYEMTPESKAGARAATAFEAMQVFGEPVPFATAFGKAGAIIGRNVKEIEKLEREAKREATKLRLDTTRFQRAEKRGDVTTARAAAGQMEERQARITQLELNKAEKVAGIAQQNKKLALDEKLGMAQIAATRAGQTDVNRQALANFIEGNVANFVQAKGRNPTPQEMAQIKLAATEDYAKTFKVDPYAALRTETGQGTLARSRIADINKELNAIELNLRKATEAEIAALKAEKAALQKQVSAGAGVPKGAGAGGGKPSLQEFLAKARAANPGVSDADLTAYYNKTYGQ
jgi:hypothetical protein